uniref:Uncharacterized protein n=1 Tax=Mesocestoides corti TaxID=53468 RepID=A0A5K3EMQ4_MESCO
MQKFVVGQCKWTRRWLRIQNGAYLAALTLIIFEINVVLTKHVFGLYFIDLTTSPSVISKMVNCQGVN